MKIFLSYCFADDSFIQRVYYLLRTQPNLLAFYYSADKRAGPFPDRIKREITQATGFVAFLGEQLGGVQQEEIQHALDLKKRVVFVYLRSEASIDPIGRRYVKDKYDPVRLSSIEEPGAEEKCAREITGLLGIRFVPYDDLPIGYPFDYEKDIVNAYRAGKGRVRGKLVEQGCPPTWPLVRQMPAGQQYPNPLGDRTEIGEVYRDSNAEVIVDARTEGRPLRSLRFPEAGLRAQLVYPRTGELKVGILVSGGIAPGVNAVISSIVDRHCLYARRSEAKGNAYALDVLGYVEGFRALLGQGAGFRRLNHGGEPDEFVRSRAERGGSMLPTSRASELLNRDLVKRADDLETVVRALTRHDGIDILYVIAGDGGMKAAHAIWTMAQNERNPVSVVAIPKTMDNDILWVWQSFGFLSAVEKAKEAILQLHTEATSNPRVCVIQLFGSDSGFVCSHAALASGVCDAILIPEVEFTMNGLSAYIQRRLRQRYHRKHPERHQPYAMILMAETAIPMDVEKYLDDGAVGLDEGERNAVRDYLENHRRVQGQTPDALRSAGLKVVTRILERDIRAMGEDYWRDFRVFSNEPRHLLRAIPPSVSDVVIGHRLGALAVDNAMAGYTDFMISQWLTEYVLVPLKLVVLGRKRVPRSGFFWNSVVANTGQPAFSPDGA